MPRTNVQPPFLLIIALLVSVVSGFLRLPPQLSTDTVSTSPYKLPYPAGDEYLVYQGNDSGGQSTHTGLSLYAFDFSMPEGSVVVASRGGNIHSIEERHGRGGCEDLYLNLANYVVINHGDGTSALYLHLQQNSVDVQEGDRIEQGQEIARSGDSGYVCGPTGEHLHFQVQAVPSVEGVWLTQSIPVSFSDQDVLAKEPDGIAREGISYRSDNSPPAVADQDDVVGIGIGRRIEQWWGQLKENVANSVNQWWEQLKDRIANKAEQLIEEKLKTMLDNLERWLEELCSGSASWIFLPAFVMLLSRIGSRRRQKRK
jgi:murein DD-endopeptidase MepM/ murein hydrolase activator NlpD